ncbi:MAG: ACP phosphodiesterase [Bacteroidetes bacterium]|nr:ACP phosphodiesterase [Bacteroidota bacterium]
MNFLAHVYLSGNDEKLIIGNLIADAVKGKQIENFEEGIVKGIKLHRLIDTFTDNHEVFKQSAARLEPVYKKYAVVIADIFYDHFLAKDFHLYSNISLSHTAHHTYSILIRNYAILPPRSKRMLPFMATQNWLEGYANLRDLQRVFNGMSRRASFVSGMENAIVDLKKDYNAFESEFHLFFPDMINYVKSVMASGQI